MRPSKRDRLEDLGVIYEKLDRYIDEFPEIHCESKHDLEPFLEKYKGEEELVDLFYLLRRYNEFMHEIWAIARGED